MPFKRVILVDDDAGYREMVTETLAREGLALSVFENPREALDLLRKQPADLLITDVQMPELNGIEFTREAMKLPSPPVIIVISAYGTMDTALEAIQAGAYDYINKSLGPKELIMTIRKAEERERLAEENRRLKEEIGKLHAPSEIVAQSEPMKKLLALAKRVAPYDASALLVGESGTGKDLIARFIHRESPRANKPFVAVNCGAIPETLLESELFGHLKGAFTGAYSDKTGIFEEADGGTIFLDEIGELPESIQIKLLRILQEGEVRPVGATREKKVNVRLISATLRDLEEDIKRGRFREDLFYRISVFPIKIPPLRERPEDIGPLTLHYLKKFNEELGVKKHSLDSEAELKLLRHSWPGNVRELMNVLKRAAILAEGDIIKSEDISELIGEGSGKPGEENLSIKKASREMEERLIKKALEFTGGNRTQAAKLLEISLRSLIMKIKEYEIDA